MQRGVLLGLQFRLLCRLQHGLQEGGQEVGLQRGSLRHSVQLLPIILSTRRLPGSPSRERLPGACRPGREKPRPGVQRIASAFPPLGPLQRWDGKIEYKPIKTKIMKLKNDLKSLHDLYKDIPKLETDKEGMLRGGFAALGFMNEGSDTNSTCESTCNPTCKNKCNTACDAGCNSGCFINCNTFCVNKCYESCNEDCDKVCNNRCNGGCNLKCVTKPPSSSPVPGGIGLESLYNLSLIF